MIRYVPYIYNTFIAFRALRMLFMDNADVLAGRGAYDGDDGGRGGTTVVVITMNIQFIVHHCQNYVYLNDGDRYTSSGFNIILGQLRWRQFIYSGATNTAPGTGYTTDFHTAARKCNDQATRCDPSSSTDNFKPLL